MRFSVLRSAVVIMSSLLVTLPDKVTAEDNVSEDGVMVVTADTIEQAIKDYDHLVVEFYAPWCGHCKKLAPILSEAAIKMKEIDENIVFAKMNCAEGGNKAFKEQMGIKGFPSFRLFKGSMESAEEHSPPRVMPQLMQYFKNIKDGVKPPPPKPAPKRRPSPPLVEPEDSEVSVLTKATFEDFIEDNEYAVVEFYAPWCGHCKKLFPEFTKASIELKNHDPPIKLGKIDLNDEVNKKVGAKLGIRGYPTLKIFHNDDMIDYSGPRDAAGIVKYLSDHRKKTVTKEDRVKEDEDGNGENPPADNVHTEL